MKLTLTQRVEALEKRLDNKCKGWHIFTMGASKCDRCGIENPSYTAMRSTGKTATEVVEAIKRANKYCECAKPMICSTLINGSKCGICHYCNKSIKPQEDKMSQIIRILFFSKGWDGTKAEAYDIADRILAIVKGE